MAPEVLLAFHLTAALAVSSDIYPSLSQPLQPVLPVPPLSSATFDQRLPEPLPDSFEDVPDPVKLLTPAERALLPKEQQVCPPPPGMHAVFEQAAHFPLPGFGLQGEHVPQGAAVIYEGMSITVYDAGRYEVRFILEAPLTTVTLRLQLPVYRRQPGPPEIMPPVLIGMVTLPPITVCPEPADCGHPSAAWLIRHRGWSPLLQEASCLPGAEGFTIGRTGVARFGSKPDFDFFVGEID